MNTKLINRFLAASFFLYIGIMTPSRIYAVQGELNYDVGGLPQGVVTTEDTNAIQECNLKLSIANQTSLDLKQQKDSCLQTNSLLNKTMKESVNQTIKQKNLFTISLIMMSIIACAFFLSTLLLLMKLKKKKIETPLPTQIPNQTST